MDDIVHLLVLHQFVECIKVADVHLHKFIVRLVLYVLQVSEVARICQLVKVDNFILWIFVYE